MEKDNNSNTYVIGIMSDLEDCSTIVLYRSTRLLTTSISNMEHVLEVLEKNKNYTKVNKTIEGGKSYYLFDRLDENNNIRYVGFDTIIYINHLGIPIGYTKFNTIKGLIPEKLKIVTDFNTYTQEGSDWNNEGEFEIEYSLDNITEYVSLTRKLLVNEPYGFSTAKEIRDTLDQLNPSGRYTNNVYDLISSPEKSIVLNYGLLNNEGFFRLNLITEMIIPENEGFYNIQFGYYKGEVICYNWRIQVIDVMDGNNRIGYKSILDYKITSLSRKGKFGEPVLYTQKNSYNTIVIKSTKDKINKVNYFSGRFVSISMSNGLSEVWNVIDGTKVILDGGERGNHVIDLWGPGQIIELPDVLSKKNIVEFIPKVRDLFIDIKNYRQTIHLEKIIGEWFVFRETRTNLSKINTISKSFLIYTNMTKTVMVSEDYDAEPILINDNVLVLRTTETLNNTKYDYYSYFTGSGNFVSENAMMALDIVSGIKKEKVYNAELGYIQYNENNVENHINKLIRIDNIGSNILDSYLQGFRKFTCPEDLKVPEIVGTLNGLIYYRFGDKIKLL